MRASSLFKGLITCAALAVFSGSAAADVLLQQDFNGEWSTINPPPGWRITFDFDTSANDWHRAPDLGVDPWEANETPYALLSDSPPEAGTDSLISPSLNCTDYSTVVLTCSTHCQLRIGPFDAALRGSVGGGPFENLIFEYVGQTIQGQLQTFELAWAANQPNVRLLWYFNGDNVLIDHWAVDNVTVTGQTATYDVALEEILAPKEQTNDVGETVTPRCVVRNDGNEVTEPFPVLMRIGIGYVDTVIIENLAAGAKDTVSFDTWRASERDTNRVVSFTALIGDNNRSNDTARTWTYVRLRDIKPLEINAPADTVDSFAIVTPQVRVQNIGNVDSDSFRCHMQIGGSYHDDEFVDNLIPGETRTINFRDWRADTAGRVTATCWTALNGDHFPGNDTISRTFFVRGLSYLDIKAAAILAPVGALEEGTFVIPTGVASNVGVVASPTQCHFAITDSEGYVIYNESVFRELNAGQSDTVNTFPIWTAQPEGRYTAHFWVFAEGDQDPDNDSLAREFTVLGDIHDVELTRIVAPSGIITLPAVVTPRAVVTNTGAFPEGNIKARMFIRKGASIKHRDSVIVEGPLQPSQSQEVSFRAWVPVDTGIYTARCSTVLVIDQQPSNDFKQVTFTIQPDTFTPGWTEKTPLPTGAKGVKKGGACWFQAGADGPSVYAMKGEKTSEFYQYDIAREDWVPKPDVPMGPSNKPVYKYGDLCGDHGRYIYVIKGYKTREFWRFDTQRDTWRQLADIPGGPKDKEPKYGTCMDFAYVGDRPYIYLKKGDRLEFYRYHIQGDSWQPRADAPPGEKGKWKQGTDIAYDGENRIYAIMGKYNLAFSYNIAENTWDRTHKPLPFVGRSGKKKKLYSGGSWDWFEGKLFALKGGNTVEFWKFLPDQDSWTEIESVPSYGSTQKKKRVKDGGDIASDLNGSFYALKGNKTLEFWNYRFAAGSGIDSDKRREPATILAGSQFTVRPNPARTSVSLALPPAAVVSVRVFDAGGKLLHAEEVTGRNTVTLQVQGLPPGIYFVRADHALGRETVKLVIE